MQATYAILPFTLLHDMTTQQLLDYRSMLLHLYQNKKAKPEVIIRARIHLSLELTHRSHITQVVFTDYRRIIQERISQLKRQTPLHYHNSLSPEAAESILRGISHDS